jgi:hypothetical protein
LFIINRKGYLYLLNHTKAAIAAAINRAISKIIKYHPKNPNPPDLSLAVLFSSWALYWDVPFGDPEFDSE